MSSCKQAEGRAQESFKSETVTFVVALSTEPIKLLVLPTVSRGMREFPWDGPWESHGFFT